MRACPADTTDVASHHRLFHQLVARCALMTAAPAGVALWTFGVVPAVGVGLAVAGSELLRVRSAVRAGMPDDLSFVPSRPIDHSWLDAEGFRARLIDLERLGFVPLADFSVTYPKAPGGLARLLVHAKYCVYAEVNQVRDKGRVTPVSTTLTSILDNGWSVQTTSQEPSAVAIAFMQAKRAVWRSLPEASADELIQDHVQMRSEVCRDVGVGIGGDGTLERYFELQRADHRARRETLLHTNVVSGIVRGVVAERRPRREWLGEYRPSHVA